jgi:hypothetical protein
MTLREKYYLYLELSRVADGRIDASYCLDAPDEIPAGAMHKAYDNGGDYFPEVMVVDRGHD